MIGDKLASGATSAVFGPNEGTKITKKKWDAAFEGFDAEDFKKNGYRPIESSKNNSTSVSN